ncbi:MAG: hypothetical protein IID46_07235 [Planctomycetes bacterium]|nr:hypothetical protein [Planctomycetota bacterium]
MRTEMTESSWDFSAEQTVLRQLIGEKPNPGGPLTIYDKLLYERFYKAADREFGKTRNVGTSAITSGREWKFSTFQELPTSPTEHIRGYLDDDRCYIDSHTQDGDRMNAREVHPGTFHSQPTKDLDSDIPGDDDLFDFLKFSHLRHIVVGRNYISELSKGPDTLRLSLKLWQWERDHPYQFSRIQHRHPSGNEREWRYRYSKTALRGIGLRWPYRRKEKRSRWLTILREFGIPVRQTEVFRGTTEWKLKAILRILKGETTDKQFGQDHRLDLKEVRKWVEDFMQAGKRSLSDDRDDKDCHRVAPRS